MILFVDLSSVAHMLQVHFATIVGPCPKLEEALLDIEGKVLDVYGAVTLVDGGGLPHDFAVVVNRGFGLESHHVVAVSAGTDQSKCSY